MPGIENYLQKPVILPSDEEILKILSEGYEDHCSQITPNDDYAKRLAQRKESIKNKLKNDYGFIVNEIQMFSEELSYDTIIVKIDSKDKEDLYYITAEKDILTFHTPSSGFNKSFSVL